MRRSTANRAKWRAGYEWPLAGLFGALPMGCASGDRSNEDNEQANMRKYRAMKQPDIMRREDFLVMGTVTRRKIGADRPEIFAAIWNDFESHRQDIKVYSVDSKYYGVSFAPGPDGSFDYMAGMAVRPDATTSKDLEIRKIPAATYAVFACPVQSIGQTYGYIFGEWRAESGCQIENSAPAFEEYPPETDANAPVLLFIPIRTDHVKPFLNRMSRPQSE